MVPFRSHPSREGGFKPTPTHFPHDAPSPDHLRRNATTLTVGPAKPHDIPVPSGMANPDVCSSNTATDAQGGTMAGRAEPLLAPSPSPPKPHNERRNCPLLHIFAPLDMAKQCSKKSQFSYYCAAR